MNLAYLLSGGAPVIHTYKIAETMATAAVPVELGTAGQAGIALPADVDTTTDFVGVTLDTGTYSTTQGETEGVVSVIINPDAVYRALMYQDGNENQLSVTTNSAAETAGTVVTITTGDPAPNGPSHDEGTVVCVSGANVGQTRKITSVGATSLTVTVPFLNDIGSGDQFIHVPWTPGDVTNNNVRLTGTGGAQVEGPVGTGQAWRVLELNFPSGSVSHIRRNSYAYLKSDDSVYDQTT